MTGKRDDRGTSKLRVAVGERIRKARKRRGWTQGQLAHAVGYAHNTSLTYIEQGCNGIDVDTLTRLCLALETSPNELLGWPK